MWQVNRAEIMPLLHDVHQFVLDLLTWVCSLNAEDDEASLEASCAAAKPDSLAMLARRLGSLRSHMIKLAQCGHVDSILEEYRTITANYLGYLDGGATFYKAPDDKTAAVVQSAFNYFYHELIDTETFREVYKLSVCSRLDFRVAFGRIRRVCPYCDRRDIENPFDTSIDHFLPEHLFPLLSVYWENLLVSCTACNERTKGSKMIGTDDAGATHHIPILHPFYHEPAEFLCFDFDYETSAPRIENSATHPETFLRAENFLSVFKISEVYNFEVVRELRRVRSEVRTALRRKIGLLAASQHPINSAQLRSIVVKYLNERSRRFSALKGVSRLTKLMLDFCSFLARNVDAELQFILDTPTLRALKSK